MERIGKKEPVCIDDDLPFAVPDGWTWARLGEIGEIYYQA
jgi:type I restriction enzyme S subunit